MPWPVRLPASITLPTMRRPVSPHFEMLLTVLFWGVNFTATKVAMVSIPPLAFTAIRFSVGTALLWLILWRLEPEHRLARESVGAVIVLGLIGNTLYQICFITGLAATTATNTSLILSAMPAVVTVAAGALGMERVTRRQAWALVLATLGVITVIASRGLALSQGDWSGDLRILLAVFFWTGYTLGLRRLGVRMTPLGVTAWTLLTGTPGLILAGLPGLLRLQWTTIGWGAWVGLAYSTLFSLVAAYILWSRGVQRIGASRAALYTCATPLIATGVAVLVLGERPTLAHLVGGVLIIGGVVLGNTDGMLATAPEG